MSLTSNGLFSPMSRFGFRKELLKASCYVPTRAEVFRMPAETLFPMLRKWFYHAPPELTPSEEQRIEVIKLLRSRFDADSLDLDITALQLPGEGKSAERSG